jgi:hypothetical protein
VSTSQARRWGVAVVVYPPQGEVGLATLAAPILVLAAKYGVTKRLLSIPWSEQEIVSGTSSPGPGALVQAGGLDRARSI